jgi:hypothetical protein
MDSRRHLLNGLQIVGLFLDYGYHVVVGYLLSAFSLEQVMGLIVLSLLQLNGEVVWCILVWIG